MIVPAPARTSIKNFGYNLGYPSRAFNQILQGRFGDVGDESLRFLTNTTVGVVGLFDVASKWDIPKPRGSFGQTFQAWGWDGKNFVVLPLLGPSDERSATGRGVDWLTYPTAYINGSRNILYGVTFNNFTEDTDETLRLLKSDPDSYDTSKAIWTYAAMKEAPNWSLNGPRHAPSLETLAAATLKLNDVRFLEIMQEAKVKVPTTGKKLPFNYWIQDEPAPLVYVVPGLGAHRQTMQALSVAEALYDRGYSVVSISGMFHPEFIEKASSVEVPGNAKADRRDVWALMGAIDSWLEGEHGEDLGPRAMVGTSMGGFQALAMAAESKTRQTSCNKCCKGCCQSIKIDRFIAINPPVDLIHSLKKLDYYMEAPKQWPDGVRQERVDNAVHKAVAMMAMPENISMQAPPFDGVESKYLIGLAFRLTLRNAIYTSERTHKLGNFHHSMSRWNRQEAYEEILAMSFDQYLKEVLLPHYGRKGITAQDFNRQCDLKDFASSLSRCQQAHVITSRKDFLLSGGDLAWLQRTFGSRRLTLLERGGHVGGLLSNKGVHELLDAKLKDLKGSQ